MKVTVAQWRTILIMLSVSISYTGLASDNLGKYNPCSAPGLVTLVGL